MSGSFHLEREAHENGFDVCALWDGWMELSNAKGWPMTEVGWSRYLTRVLDSGNGPKRKQAEAKVIRFVPPEFVDWWSRQPDAHQGVEAKVAFITARYYDAWKAQREAARRAAA